MVSHSSIAAAQAAAQAAAASISQKLAARSADFDQEYAGPAPPPELGRQFKRIYTSSRVLSEGGSSSSSKRRDRSRSRSRDRKKDKKKRSRSRSRDRKKRSRSKDRERDREKRRSSRDRFVELCFRILAKKFKYKSESDAYCVDP